MDMKVNQLLSPAPVETQTQVNQSDGTFKFTLASHIAEADLQARLNTLMEDITMQGEKLGKRRDVADMRRYRSLVKEFMNEKAALCRPIKLFFKFVKASKGIAH